MGRKLKIAKKVYVYINDFSYKEEGESLKKDMMNHPKDGMVYKAIKQLVPGGKYIYKISIKELKDKEPDGLSGLIVFGTKGDTPQFSWDIEEVEFSDLIKRDDVENFDEVVDIETNPVADDIDQEILSLNEENDNSNLDEVDIEDEDPSDKIVKLIKSFKDKEEKVEESLDFVKFDSEKSRVDLIPGNILMEIGDIFGYGAKKYSPNNWKKCKDSSRYIGAALRHIYLHQSGEVFDEESGKKHLAHAVTSLIMAMWVDDKLNYDI